MNIEKMLCPYCGANIKILPGQERAECEYCGNTVIITGVESERQNYSPADDTRPALQKNEEHTTIEPIKHAIFPPPGFRSKNILHIIIAVCGYLFILSVALSMDSPLESIFFTAASLSIIDIFTDWTGLWSRLIGIRSKNLICRIAAKTIWSIVAFFAWITLMAIIETALGI